MRLLNRLLPRRMMSQLGLLFVMAIIIANLLAISGIQLMGSLLSPAMRKLAIERVELAYLSSQMSHAMPSFLQRDDGTTFWIADRAEVRPFPMRREEQRLQQILLQRPGLHADVQATFQLERTDGGRARWHFFSAARRDPLRLRSTVSLPDGRFLNGIQPVEPAFAWVQWLTLTLIALALPLILISLYCANRVVRPIRQLAAAADALSRGEWRASLPLIGPRESRDLTHNFNLMQQRLARHLEGQTRMLASMSHDLNTPLTELRLQIELLECGETRDDMLESLGDLQAMVNETLSFIRDETAQETTRACNLRHVISEVCQRYQQRGEAVSWHTDRDAIISCRPLAMKRALTNLIENALTYAGDARVSLSVMDEQIKIEVSDSGPGIEPSSLERALQPFVRLSAGQAPTGRLGGGLGLGLAISRACVQAHGGELRLNNRSPAGLCVTLLLPVGHQKLNVTPPQKVRP